MREISTLLLLAAITLYVTANDENTNEVADVNLHKLINIVIKEMGRLNDRIEEKEQKMILQLQKVERRIEETKEHLENSVFRRCKI